MTDTSPTKVDLDSLLPAGTAAGTWRLDPSRSRIEFAVKHLWGLIAVRGQFHHFTGAAEVSSDGQVVALLTLDAASVDTNMATRDKHLRSARFFNAATHPTIEVIAGAIRFLDARHANARGELVAAGQSRPIEFDTILSVDTERHLASLDTTVVVEHTTFGMTYRPLRMAAKTTHVTAHLVFARGEA